MTPEQLAEALSPNEEDAAILWAEIHRLRAAVAGPAGYASWQDAATAERVRRVKAESALAAQQAQAEPVAWCALTASGKIEYFDGKPLVMPGSVGNAIHTAPLFTSPPAVRSERDRCIATLKALKDESGVNNDGSTWLRRLTRGDCVAALERMPDPAAPPAVRAQTKPGDFIGTPEFEAWLPQSGWLSWAGGNRRTGYPLCAMQSAWDGATSAPPAVRAPLTELEAAYLAQEAGLRITSREETAALMRLVRFVEAAVSGGTVTQEHRR